MTCKYLMLSQYSYDSECLLYPQCEVNAEEGLDLVEEFYAESPQQQDQKKVNDLTQWKDIQKGLQESVQTLN